MAKFEVGDEIPVFNTKEKIAEWRKRTREIKKELENLPEGKRYICFLMKRAYSHSYSLNTKLFYKNVIKRFHATTQAPIYKDHFIRVQEGRVKLYDPEQIAFMDLKEGFIREADRELTPYEKTQKEKAELEAKVKELEGKIEKQEEPKEEPKEKKEVKNGSARGKAKR